MTDLDTLISFWQLVADTCYTAISPTFLAKIMETIKALKELKELKGE